MASLGYIRRYANGNESLWFGKLTRRGATLPSNSEEGTLYAYNRCTTSKADWSRF
jgi:hypothetical protein